MKRLAIVLALTFATAANAAPTKVEDQAAALKKQGDSAMLELHYEDALEAYAASYKLAPNPALHYNRARALEALGRYADALTAYEHFLKDAPKELLAKVPGIEDHVATVKKRVSDLTLNIAVKGARITLRNVVVGTTPLKGAIRVNAGKAKLEVSADGYLPYEKDLELPGGEELSVDVELTPRATDGTLAITADPPAALSIDGKPFGTTPVEAKLASGSHTVTLSRSGYAARTTTVVLATGERKQLTLTLDAETSTGGITSRWWFWTGIGAVVVGGTALTIGLLTSREAGKGDIDPGRVSAPLIKF